ncbi:MAG: hypothetical protein A2289_16910 [Deltaproteobacteria bacterium RIFOXYA12_FULL_58_15]|nr:MAG: hypothetical protein A2289_16910 [Deltaproteobacteria bacterium RIFOXYA12_FULL_58_15]OGR10309.1 MAG: hypothetical protein A2341_16940 [Deltaproteobacteria bacterium RIFOXYB12_FULL_58_9]
MKLLQALDALLVVLFPPRCAACDAASATRLPFGLCDACHEVLEPNLGDRCPRCDLSDHRGVCAVCVQRVPAFALVRAPYVYGGPIAELIVKAKFRGREDLASAAGRLLAADEQARVAASDATALVPVPLGAKRRRQRGYNQAAIMARTIAHTWQLPVVHALRRTRNTGAQSDRTLTARRENVAGAFAARKNLSGKVVLIDDVVTSAETANAAAAALLKGGATEVVVLAAARAPLP